MIRNDHDIRFFSNANLITDRVYAFILLVCVESQVIVTTVGEPVPVIYYKNPRLAQTFLSLEPIRAFGRRYPGTRQKHTLRILHLRDQISLSQSRNTPMNTTATTKARELRNQRCRHDLMVTTSCFHLENICLLVVRKNDCDLIAAG